MERQTNREQAHTNQDFRRDCERAGVFPSRNQFMKWKRKHGVAYQIAHRPVDNSAAKDIAVFTE